MPRRFHLDAEALERRYLELSKRHHPDRFAKAAPRERTLALLRSTEINDAYRVLKDQVRRAEYLLKLEGLDVAEEKPSRADDQRGLGADPALLMEVMELREALAEARGGGDEAKVQSLDAEVRARRSSTLQSIDEGFSGYEAGDRAQLSDLAQALIALRYYDRFLSEVEAHAAAAEQAGGA